MHTACRTAFPLDGGLDSALTAKANGENPVRIFVSGLPRFTFLGVVFYPFLNVSLYDLEAETRALCRLYCEGSAQRASELLYT
jgi:hypothetical protein